MKLSEIATHFVKCNAKNYDAQHRNPCTALMVGFPKFAHN